ncbi:GPR1/FUN34/yaaH family domain containing protein [Elaphomyces granulatus]
MSKNDIEPAMGSEAPCRDKTRSIGLFTLSPEIIEKLHSISRVEERNDKRTFANPSALGLMGFVLTDTTLAMVLMGWGGASSAASVVGIFFFTGPVLLLLSTIFEWIMGNFFTMMVNGYLCVFYLSLGIVELPSAGIAASYSTAGNATDGSFSIGYNMGLSLYTIALGSALLTFFLFSLRINVVLALIFSGAAAACYILSAAYWNTSVADLDLAMRLQHIAGGLLFVIGLLAWYATVGIMAKEMDFPVRLPMGDLSRFWYQTNMDPEH